MTDKQIKHSKKDKSVSTSKCYTV